MLETTNEQMTKSEVHDEQRRRQKQIQHPRIKPVHDATPIFMNKEQARDPKSWKRILSLF
jgi:hypothetical protein